MSLLRSISWSLFCIFVVLISSAQSAEWDLKRVSGFEEYCERNSLARSIAPSDSVVFPIIYRVSWAENLAAQQGMPWGKTLEAFGGADWCYTVDLESVAYSVAVFEEPSRYVGYARLQGRIVEDHLFTESGEISIVAVLSEVPGKILYPPGHWNAGDLVGRRVLVSGYFGNGILSLNKEAIFFVEGDGGWSDQFGREIEEGFIWEILGRRKDALNLRSQFAQSRVVVIGELNSDTPGHMAINGEPVEFSVHEVLKGAVGTSVAIFRYSDPWSCVNRPHFYQEVKYLIFLNEAGDGKLILESGQNSAFGLVEGALVGSSGFGFANLDSVRSEW